MLHRFLSVESDVEDTGPAEWIASAELIAAARNDVPKLAKAYMDAMEALRYTSQDWVGARPDVEYQKAAELLRRYEGGPK